MDNYSEDKIADKTIETERKKPSFIGTLGGGKTFLAKDLPTNIIYVSQNQQVKDDAQGQEVEYSQRNI